MLAFGMPAQFTPADVARIAALAYLDLEPAELDLFARQLGDILAYATEVQQVETAGVEPTASLILPHAADRPDEPGPSLSRAAALANAPDAADGLFRVPRVIA